jgi:tRNA pseudouridine13 synthase
LTALQNLAAAFRCRQADLGLAGIKDMQAVTYQFCTVQGISPDRIWAARSYLQQRGMDVGSVSTTDRMLRKGDLWGNRFEIVVRNLRRVSVKGTQESLVPVDEKHVGRMVERVRASGFINFYGEQRVGEPGPTELVGVRTSDVGRAMCQLKFGKAVDLLMTGRKTVRDQQESEEVRHFRQTWKESGGDPVSTLKQLPAKGLPRERLVLQGLKRFGTDQPLAAIRCLQHSERTFYISAVRLEQNIATFI